MAFTYDLTSGFTDLTRVRFHINDVVEDEARFQDEEIVAVIEEAGSWQAAVIDLLENLILKLSTPNFQADWLRVDNSTARDGYVLMLSQKKRKFGGGIRGSAKHVYRADSDLDEEPTYPPTSAASGNPGW